MKDVPDFSTVAKGYGAARPGYPAELFDWLASTVTPRSLALDVATGSGQAAWGLAHHFDRVIAMDVSAEQLRHAKPHERIAYRIGHAEQTGLPDGSVDLVVAAAAVHWFDLPRFYDEVRRVTRRGGVAAVWTYHVARVDAPLDGILWSFYKDVVGPYYPPHIQFVDERYEGIHLPGEPLTPPEFHSTLRWNARQVAAFVSTWSAVPIYIAETQRDPVPALEAEVAAAFGGPDVVRELRFPLYVRAARL